MKKILDIHTHHAAPQPFGVVNIRVRKETEGYLLDPEQAYSVGIHPWDTVFDAIETKYEIIDSLAQQPEVVIIGEAGIDLNIGGPLFRQLNVFRHNVDLSESLHKPLLIHDVKAHDVIVGAHRDLKPSMPWAIHGFRQKPQVAAMLIKAGLYISFGPDFNADTLREVPVDRILAETDESELNIEEVITRLAFAKGITADEMTAIIAENSARFLGC